MGPEDLTIETNDFVNIDGYLDLVDGNETIAEEMCTENQSETNINAQDQIDSNIIGEKCESVSGEHAYTTNVSHWIHN